jgi:hypothetical protein
MDDGSIFMPAVRLEPRVQFPASMFACLLR